MGLNRNRIFLDSCIVIYLIEGASAFQKKIKEALDEYDDCEICVSDLVRMECHVVPLRNNDKQTLESYEQFFARAGFLALNRGVFNLAAQIRADSNVKTPDAIHLAAAIYHGCDQFWTNDTPDP
ncbi:MAG: PIN domain-containing protein [Candidatus Sumerlaeota bacterium]|nr:PIN domain-containing protein [Candidatus Sumerlaeota bacterium]